MASAFDGTIQIHGPGGSVDSLSKNPVIKMHLKIANFSRSGTTVSCKITECWLLKITEGGSYFGYQLHVRAKLSTQSSYTTLLDKDYDPRSWDTGEVKMSGTKSWTFTDNGSVKLEIQVRSDCTCSGHSDWHTVYSKTLPEAVIPPADITVSYDGNATSVTGVPSSQSVQVNESFNLRSGEPQRSNYYFYKWNTNKSGTGTSYSSGASAKFSKDTKLYAMWGALVTYKPNGGTIGGSTSDYVQEAKVGSNTTIAGKTTATKPAKAGQVTSSYTATLNANGGSGLSPTSLVCTYGSSYRFTGWNTKANGSGTDYAAGDTKSITSPLTLYAQYQSTTTPVGIDLSSVTVNKSVNAIFNNNSGGTAKVYITEHPDTGGNSDYKKVKLPLKSWNTKSDGTGTSYKTTATNVVLTKNITLYAIWGSAEVGDLPAYKSSGSNRIYKVTNGNKYKLSSTAGWTTTSSGTSGVTSSYKISDRTSFWAHYQVAIDYYNDTVNTAPDNTTFYDLGNVTTRSGPTREAEVGAEYLLKFFTDPSASADRMQVSATDSYKFKNWNTAKNGSGTSYAAKAKFTTDVTLKLYAMYDVETTYPVVKLPTPTSSEEGLVFDGWYTAYDGGTLIGRGGASYEVRSSREFFAHWTDTSLKSPIWIMIENAQGQKEWVKYEPTDATGDKGYIWRMDSDHKWKLVRPLYVIRSTGSTNQWVNVEDLI